MKKSILFFGLITAFAACTSKTESHSSTSTSSTTVTHSDGTTETVSSSISTVDAGTFKSQMESAPGTVLDVRTAEEVAEGHLANSINIDINGSDFESKINELDKQAPVYVYCRSGGRSARAADILKANGFSTIVNLDGGITAWTQAGNETVK
ncbi:MAG: rhodanese-like domain-containing protein [Flavobacteriales bacterium]|nr:rhodanese-like domain-containing protein [Flavobacteriales bacterium]